MEKIIWADRVSNEVLLIVKDGRNILITMKRREAIWNGHTLLRK